MNIFSEKKLSSWNDHKAFTDCSEPMPYDSAIWWDNLSIIIRPVISHFTRHNGVKKIGEKNALNGFVKMVNERIICTTIIKGERDDHQGLFEKVVEVYNENFDDLNRSYRHHNLGGEMYCTHLR